MAPGSRDGVPVDLQGFKETVGIHKKQKPQMNSSLMLPKVTFGENHYVNK